DGNGATYFNMSLPVFGKGRPRKPRPTVEQTPRIDVRDLRRSPFTPHAREATIRVVIGKPPALEEVEHARFFVGDGQRYFLCSACSRKVQHLYVPPLQDERLICRKCAALDYRSRTTRRRGINRARNLRRKLGAPANILAAVPPRPPHWSRAYYRRLVGELAR